MKSGQIEYWVEIPISIDFHIEPPDESEKFNFGPHVVVDMINYADEDKIFELIGKETDAIKQACLEDTNDTR